MDSPEAVNRWMQLGLAGLAGLAGLVALAGCGWHEDVRHETEAVERRLGTISSPGLPDKAGFRSLTQAKHPYLALRVAEAARSRLPDDLLSDTGVVVTLNGAPDDEALARRISDAAGMPVRLVGPEWSDAGSFVSGWLASWEDELAGEGGVWAGPLDRLLDGWTNAAGWRWEYDAARGTVDVVRSETVVFDVHALQGQQIYSVTTTTQGSGGEATSGATSQSITSDLTYDPWVEIGELATAAAGADGAVAISATSGTVTVSGLPRATDRVRQYLAHVNRHVLRPVTLSMHLYSVRFDRGSDYEVGLTGLLPQVFGTNFALAVEPGSVSVVKPRLAGAGSTLQATVSALRSVGSASRQLSVDVPTLNGRPAQFFDLFDEAYLKEVSTSIDDGVQVVELTAGTVSSGFGLSFVAQIVGPDEVLARITATIQDRPEFRVFASGGNQIQLPAGGRRAIVATQRIAKGETLLLTGFRDRSSSGERSGTFDAAIPFPGGGAGSAVGRVETALLVTAAVGEPFGISERRVGAGAAGFVRAANGNAGPAGIDAGRAVSEAPAAAVGEADG